MAKKIKNDGSDRIKKTIEIGKNKEAKQGSNVQTNLEQHISLIGMVPTVVPTRAPFTDSSPGFRHIDDPNAPQPTDMDGNPIELNDLFAQLFYALENGDASVEKQAAGARNVLASIVILLHEGYEVSLAQLTKILGLLGSSLALPEDATEQSSTTQLEQISSPKS